MLCFVKLLSNLPVSSGIIRVIIDVSTWVSRLNIPVNLVVW